MNRRNSTISVLLLTVALTSVSCRAESGAAGGSQSGRRIFDEIMQKSEAENWDGFDLGAIVQKVGTEFVGTRYEGGLLDHGDTEELVVTFAAFDCQLFIETVLAMARGIRERDRSYEGFTRRLEEQRYRAGVRDGYCSRLHYFTEWIRDNEQRGIVQDVSASLGGVREIRRLDFMSRHRDAYPRFASNDSVLAGIREMESGLAATEMFYVPEASIRERADLLRPGDIIATATGIEGLDVSHTGLAYVSEDGSVGFLHASTKGGVTVAPDLQSYLEGNAVQIGIVVVRPLEAAHE